MADEPFGLIERAVIRASLHETYAQLNLPESQEKIRSAEAVYDALRTIDKTLDVKKTDVTKYVLGQNLAKATIDKIEPVVVTFLLQRLQDIEKCLSTKSYTLLCKTLDVEQPGTSSREITRPRAVSSSTAMPSIPAPSTPGEGDTLRDIMEHWDQPVSRGTEVLRPGIYQIFRRYKPTFAQRKNFPSYRIDENHAVVCELALVDSKKMECMIVTAEFNVYWGTMYINHQQILSVVAQRRRGGNQKGVYQRMYAIGLKGVNPDGRLYSGVGIKAGDYSRQPLATECIFLRIPVVGNYPLYREFQKIRTEARWDRVSARGRDIIADYIIEPPPRRADPLTYSGNQKTRRIKDMPVLRDMIRPRRLYREYGVSLLRESLRALTIEVLEDWDMRTPLEIFRHSAAAPSGSTTTPPSGKAPSGAPSRSPAR